MSVDILMLAVTGGGLALAVYYLLRGEWER